MKPSNAGTAERPNVILICADQWRGDCLSIAGHPQVQTPHLDELARRGTRFTKAYSATPTCVPARAALFTGQSQERHGRVGYEEGVPFAAAHPVTLAGEFSRAGYHTQAIGKMHVYPERARVGFDDVVLHDGYLHHARGEHRQDFRFFDDYVPWLRRQPGIAVDEEYFDSGVNCNSVAARPWDKPERVHPTNWLATEAIDWMYRRDPTRPFFLYLSFHRPHPPYDPPAWAMDQYSCVSEDELPVGDWISDWQEHRRDGDYQAAVAKLPPAVVRRARMGYYGLMTQLDLQLNRIVESLADFGLDENTVIAFTSDHGEMMGDHQMFRKAVPYEGSARVPLIIHDPRSPAASNGSTVDDVVELRDLMPTLLDLAGVEIPATVDGLSLAGHLAGGPVPTRTHLHGEHTYFGQSIQWITDGRFKYIWASGSGAEQLFDLDADPGEFHNLIGEPAVLDDERRCRGRLISALEDREEGFVKAGELVVGAEPVTVLRQTRQRVAAAAANVALPADEAARA